jgi:hypothetical protein
MSPSRCDLPREHLADAPRGIGQAGDGMPAHGSMPTTSTDEPCTTQHADGDRLLPGPRSMHFDFSNGSIELKAVAFQLVFGTTLLSYTIVKFIQEKNEAGIRGEATQAKRLRAGRPPPPSVQLRGIRRSGQDFRSAASLAAACFQADLILPAPSAHLLR